MPLLTQMTFHGWFSIADVLNGGEPITDIHTTLANIRDRIFQALFERLSAAYKCSVSADARKYLENAFLAFALIPLFILIYVHVSFIQTPVDCLSQVSKDWPRDGLLRIELGFKDPYMHSYGTCYYDGLSVRRLNDVKNNKALTEIEIGKHNQTHFTQKLAFNDVVSSMSVKNEVFSDFRSENLSPDSLESAVHYLASLSEKKSDEKLSRSVWSPQEYVIEYTLEYGFLKLSAAARQKLKIPTLVVIIDPHDEKCFGNRFSQFLLKYVVGYSDVLMNSIKSLVDKDESKGFVKNVVTGDQYRFVNRSLTWTSYAIAAITMVAFTLSISMLLRYSHHQIFMFIVQLLSVLDYNGDVSFPAASLLTVVFALVGMEAIMSEFFNDSTTAFYIILIVWIADQYDNICCHNIVTKRHWLRFFFLYHFAFYAYDHRFNGQYSTLALFTSWMFIQHSMIYFYHHYELPSISTEMYEEDLEPRNFNWTFNFQPHRNFGEEGRSFLLDSSDHLDDDGNLFSDHHSDDDDSLCCDSGHRSYE